MRENPQIEALFLGDPYQCEQIVKERANSVMTRSIAESIDELFTRMFPYRVVLRINKRSPQDSEKLAAMKRMLFEETVDALEALAVPSICRFNGSVFGGATDLALACDFIVAADDAFFIMAYANVGLSPDGGASWAMSRSLPRQLVSELLLAGERMGAQRLHALGVVNRLAPPGTALDDALALDARLNAKAPNALASIKELMNDAPSATLTAQLAQERDQFVRNLHHPNAGIGIEAFLAKQTPRYE
jgi:enoyl-CoA hydratase/carnithine racemase